MDQQHCLNITCNHCRFLVTKDSVTALRQAYFNIGNLIIFKYFSV